MTAPNAHALLSASASHRWLHCPPSARIEAEMPDTASVYAEEGTLAHAVAELVLRRTHIDKRMTKHDFATALEALQARPLYDAEMLRHAQTFTDLVTGIALKRPAMPHIASEIRLEYGHVAPGGFGTGDCVIVDDEVLHVVDYKYGKGVPVSAEGNTQMMLYAIGALRQYEGIADPKTVRMTICQPRLDSASETEISAEDLRAWGAEIAPIAQQAYDGAGERKAGEWCRFCRARSSCAARSQNGQDLSLTFAKDKRGEMTDDDVVFVLQHADEWRRWIDDVSTRALELALSGHEYAGYKVVEGTSRRVFIDQDAAFSALQAAGVEEALLYERKPLTLAATEKVVGKALFAKCAGAYVDKPRGKPALVPVSDKRPEYKQVQLQEAFGG